MSASTVKFQFDDAAGSTAVVAPYKDKSHFNNIFFCRPVMSQYCIPMLCITFPLFIKGGPQQVCHPSEGVPVPQPGHPHLRLPAPERAPRICAAFQAPGEHFFSSAVTFPPNVILTASGSPSWSPFTWRTSSWTH